MHQADMKHMQVADGVYAYLEGSMTEDMTFTRSDDGMTPMAYSDASHADQGTESGFRHIKHSILLVTRRRPLFF